ncbi:MAG TPA: GNAT family N-acetyltransferase [Bacteroidales bacterium]|nr:GNAT family N-acetyltransferase [Bacteroidales bacterium]
MGLTVEKLTERREHLYEAFLLQDDAALLYSSLLYRRLIKRLYEGEDHYLLALEDGVIRGVLPAFLMKSRLGNSLISLPFFGSNGGVIEYEGNRQVWFGLLNAFRALAEKKKCVTYTLIASPFHDRPQWYESILGMAGPSDSRTGQISMLPAPGEDIAGTLLAGFYPFTRRMIRKAEKNGLLVKQQNDTESLEFLQTVHRENMRRKGGEFKPADFFSSFPLIFRPEKDYNIWVARKGGTIVAALLLFYYHNTVEYYLPALLHRHRSLQAQSLIIYRAMADAVSRGYRYWNWGGTWPSQKGVYDYKKKWNTRDYPYHYYNRVLDPRILEYSVEEVRSAFPHGYVVPFSQLREQESSSRP